ncbi:hypothetical protein N9F31_04425 [Pseudomonadales bacterium]|nr:hypothetical protein [Pseudomonadales bacterium]
MEGEGEGGGEGGGEGELDGKEEDEVLLVRLLCLGGFAALNEWWLQDVAVLFFAGRGGLALLKLV